MISQELPKASATLQRTAWGSILTVVTMLGTLSAACATPFAALGALAAIFLPRRDAFVLIGVNWIVNQVIGFGWLHYPLNADCYRGGLNLCIAAVGAAAAAMLAHRALQGRIWMIAVIGSFAAAFVAYEALLYALSPWRGDGDFAWPVVLHMLKVNSIAFTVLLILQRAAFAIGFAVRSAMALDVQRLSKSNPA